VEVELGTVAGVGTGAEVQIDARGAQLRMTTGRATAHVDVDGIAAQPRQARGLRAIRRRTALCERRLELVLVELPLAGGGGLHVPGLIGRVLERPASPLVEAGDHGRRVGAGAERGLLRGVDLPEIEPEIVDRQLRSLFSGVPPWLDFRAYRTTLVRVELRLLDRRAFGVGVQATHLRG